MYILARSLLVVLLLPSAAAGEPLLQLLLLQFYLSPLLFYLVQSNGCGWARIYRTNAVEDVICQCQRCHLGSTLHRSHVEQKKEGDGSCATMQTLNQGHRSLIRWGKLRSSVFFQKKKGLVSCSVEPRCECFFFNFHFLMKTLGHISDSKK